eukprot:6705965-Prymnesium_polylepis.1
MAGDGRLLPQPAAAPLRRHAARLCRVLRHASSAHQDVDHVSARAHPRRRAVGSAHGDGPLDPPAQQHAAPYQEDSRRRARVAARVPRDAAV